MQGKIIKGKKGEDIAAEFLQKLGYTIVDRNWRYSRVGEIDIIAQDKQFLVFVEVKARSSTNYGHPLEAVNQNKFNTMKKVAEAYIQQEDTDKYKGFRLDVIGILMGKEPDITHLKDVF